MHEAAEGRGPEFRRGRFGRRDGRAGLGSGGLRRVESGNADVFGNLEAGGNKVFVERAGRHFAGANPRIDAASGEVGGASQRGSREELGFRERFLERDLDHIVHTNFQAVLDRRIDIAREPRARPRHPPAESEESDSFVARRDEVGDKQVHPAAVVQRDDIDIGAGVVVDNRDYGKLPAEGFGNVVGPAVDEDDAVDLPGCERARLMLGLENVRAFLRAVVVGNQGHVVRDRRRAHAREVFVTGIESEPLREGEDVAELSLVQDFSPSIPHLLGGLEDLLPRLGMDSRQFSQGP